MENRQPLSDEEIEQIAARASEIAYARFYQKVGESVVRKGLFILGVSTQLEETFGPISGEFSGMFQMTVKKE